MEQQAGEIPAQPVPVVAATRSASSRPGRRRRPSLLIGAGVAAVASVAGYALLRAADGPAVWTSMPGTSLPAAVGPPGSASTTASGVPARSGDSGGKADSGQGPESTEGRRTGEPSPTGVTSATPSAGRPAATTGTPTSTVPAPPIGLLPNPITTGRGLLVTGNGLCLDLRGGDAAEGREVHIDDCNGTSPQRWRLNPDQTLEVLDMCAYLVGDGTVQLTRCDGRTTAQWQLFADGRLTNAATGQCLTDPSSGARPGRPVIVAACATGNNQLWTFR
ncbi:RICIN domain-containing protein [Actinoplanes utahensis]|uniref:RICIN domain-containing protein n=1 Tax=Actinoplanes utahensis TaxID=1869 RepID=UPI001376603A|nr:RICIN domain-containing protein [Actinoplanes utahensis]